MRSLVTVLLTAILAAACSGGGDDASSSTSTAAASTSAAPTTTVPAATSTAPPTTAPPTSTTSTTAIARSTTTTTRPATTTTTSAPTTTVPRSTTTTVAASGNNPPTVTITSPSGRFDATYDAAEGRFGANVPLSATATDPDGDAVTISWFSSEEGFLGTGASIVVRLHPQGDASQPRITAVATDARGAKGEASRQIIVWIPSDQ